MNAVVHYLPERPERRADADSNLMASTLQCVPAWQIIYEGDDHLSEVDIAVEVDITVMVHTWYSDQPNSSMQMDDRLVLHAGPNNSDSKVKTFVLG